MYDPEKGATNLPDADAEESNAAEALGLAYQLLLVVAFGVHSLKREDVVFSGSLDPFIVVGVGLPVRPLGSDRQVRPTDHPTQPLPLNAGEKTRKR